MAHEVETMAFAHETPWHGLGVHVPADLRPEDMAKAAGIDWEVEKRPLLMYREDGECVQVPGKRALVRKTDGRIFDVVGERWNPVQNRELLAVFKRFCDEGGATMETAGALKNGKMVWGLANLGTGFVLPNGDAVKGYLLMALMHQSGYATIGRLTGVRVVCANTFAQSGGFDGASQLRVPHTMEFNAEQAADQIGIARAGMSELEKNALLLSKLNLSRDDALRLLAPIYQPDIEPKEIVDDFDKANRTVKGIMEAALSGAGQDVDRDTGWHLFNGATYYANHTARGSRDNRFASTLVGYNNTQLNKLFGQLVEMAQ